MIQRRAFERLLRNVLSFPSRPAVIVFMTMLARRFPDTQENDLLVIAQHYRVPVVSTRCASLHTARTLIGIVQHYRAPVVSNRCVLHVPAPCAASVTHRIDAADGCACQSCRGAFLEAMANKTNGFRVDGNSGGRGSDEEKMRFFFAPDDRHPNRKGHKYMAELGIHLFQQVRSVSWCFVSMSFHFRASTFSTMHARGDDSLVRLQAASEALSLPLGQIACSVPLLRLLPVSMLCLVLCLHDQLLHAQSSCHALSPCSASLFCLLALSPCSVSCSVLPALSPCFVSMCCLRYQPPLHTVSPCRSPLSPSSQGCLAAAASATATTYCCRCFC